MARLRKPARLACWIAAVAAGSPIFWLGAFLVDQYTQESATHLIWRAKVYTNLWLMIGASAWYIAWSFGTLLLPRHATWHRHSHPLHRWIDIAIVVLIPTIGGLYWITGDPDPRNFRRMMPTDGVFLTAVLFTLLNGIACVQIWYLERLHPLRHTDANEVEAGFELCQHRRGETETAGAGGGVLL